MLQINERMLTFKQTVFLLVSIITILALIAIATGLSPLYWPHPKISPKAGNNEEFSFDKFTKTDRSILDNLSRTLTTKVTNVSTIKPQLTTRPKPLTKKTLLVTLVNSVTTLPTTTRLTSTNTTNVH
ncbi:hypothetical protein I4U23_029387 [Adineta vaga]|nr:hypothetical protein I4U23_029387 [Adineta vaga]